MFSAFKKHVKGTIDPPLFFSAFALVVLGIVTMNSFAAENAYFERQIVWAAVSVLVFFVLCFVDFRFLRRTGIIISLYGAIVFVLLILFALGETVQGAQSWFNIGLFSIQPSDPAKLIVILLLAKYFSRRHIEIAHVRHILVSGAYAFIPFALIFLQPDFGSALIIGSIWFGMVVVSGISKKHLIAVFLIAAVSFFALWNAAFTEEQQERILSFLHPLADLEGAGYSAYQSTIAVGSGQLLGKGVGYGTQSKLQFLPESETDFIFAAFAEEWGFVGVVFVFVLFSIVIWRIVAISMRGATNFETFFGIGLAVLIMSHFTVHVGINIGLLPVTGTTLPFMSYGGSHLLTEFAGLGILMGMRRYAQAVHKEDTAKEFLGL